MSMLLPLFPLQLVVFPRTQLPLHIFEDRYKEMIREVVDNRSEFGIVLAKDEGIANAGCTVVVEKVITEYPDGRLDIVTGGRRRFEIVYLDQEKSYLRGQVEFFDDDASEPAPEELRDRAVEGFRALSKLSESKSVSEPVLTDPQLSFQLAQLLPDVDLQNRLLRSRSETERLQQFNEFIRQQIPRLRQTERMRSLAPQNGFGHKILGV